MSVTGIANYTLPLLVAAAMIGCQTAQLSGPLADDLAGSDAESQMEFWHTMAMRSTVSNDEALHGLLLYLDGEDPSQDYAQRVDGLKARGLLMQGFDRPGNDVVSRGTLATAIVGALKIKGGLMLQVFGPRPRYAVRELQYAGIYPRSSTNQTFSGSQYVAVMGRVDDYAQSRLSDWPEEPPLDDQDGPAGQQGGEEADVPAS